MSDRSSKDTAGASARREGVRRRASREARVWERHPRIGGLLLALQPEPEHERAWTRGAQGEELVQQILERRCHDDVRLLHDRRIPGSRANIDHIAIAPSGVWVIDTKNHRGRAVIHRHLFGPQTLTIGGREQSGFAGLLERQVEAVRSVLGPEAEHLMIRGVLCMPSCELPQIGRLVFRDVPLLRPQALARALNRRGSLEPAVVERVTGCLSQTLPSA